MTGPSSGARGGRWGPVGEGMALLAVTLPLALWLRMPTVWFLAPALVIVLGRRRATRYGLTLRNPGHPGFHVRVAGVVFGAYLLGHYVYGRYWVGAPFHLTLPMDFWRVILEQVLVVALPEEFFFRGYLQTQFDRSFGTPWRCLGARCGWGLVVAAVLFAVCHVFHGGAGRLVVVFPGLWYGWLRARTDTVAVPVVYHAASNLLMAIMVASLQR